MRNTYHIIKVDRAWQSKLEGAEIPSIIDSSRDKVITSTIELARTNEPSLVILHSEEGEKLVLENKNFYLVGGYWSGEDKWPLFFDESIWRNGYSDQYLEIVKKVKKGDILFAKSSFTSKTGGQTLRIKGIGIVIANNEDGYELKVKWYPLKEFKDFEGKGYYSRTIEEVSDDDIGFFWSDLRKLELLDKELIEVRSWEKRNVASMSADSPDGPDYLGFEPDIKALSQVMAYRRVQPPLAIGLFGRWGSGKSFFMEKLSERIGKLASEASKETPFCSGIVQIKFNAWSYLDSNLWAGLISKIFDGLFQYISNNAKDGKKDEIERVIAGKISIAKEEVNAINDQEDRLRTELKKNKEKQDLLVSKLEKKSGEIKKKSQAELIQKLDDSFGLSGRLAEKGLSEVKLSKIISNVGSLNPKELHRKLKSRQLFLMELFDKRLVGIMLLLGLVLLSLIWFFDSSVATLNGLVSGGIVALSLFIGKIKKVVNSLRPYWTQLELIEQDYRREMLKLKEEFAVEERQLERQVSLLQRELEANEEVKRKLNSEISKLEYKKNNLLASEALNSFIEDRAKGDTYKRFYGIISKIRDDFEILSQLFVEANKEETSEAQLKERQDFINCFNKPLERIILYVDDLDRCSESQVVKVLEAVNLLLAFPLFIVIVGVDPRWVKNALIKEHQGQFGDFSSDLNSKDRFQLETANYLEKIFQVPFHLKQARGEAMKKMLTSLAPVKDIEYNPATNLDEYLYHESGIISEGYSKDVESSRFEANIEIKHPDSMALEPIELEIMQNLYEIIGPNPRAIKRFVNVYLLIRAHEYRVDMSQSQEEEYLISQFLLALCIGPYKCLVDALEEKFVPAPGIDLSSFFNKNYGNEMHGKRKKDLYLADLNEIIGHYPLLRRLKTIDNNIVYAHYDFIRRFTFRDLEEELSFD